MAESHGHDPKAKAHAEAKPEPEAPEPAPGTLRHFVVVHDGVGIHKKGDEITSEDLVGHDGKPVDLKRLVRLGAIAEQPAPKTK